MVLGLQSARNRIARGLYSETQAALAADIGLEMDRLMHHSHLLRARIEKLPDEIGRSWGRAPELLAAARLHAALHAVTAALWFWIEGGANLDEFGKRGDWVYLVLRRVGELFDPSLELERRSSDVDGRVASRLSDLVECDRWFSMFAPPLAVAGSIARGGPA
jgi:hypothetical protein